MAGTVCFAVLASAQAALAEILGPENVSPGLPEATAEAGLPKLTAFFQQLIRQTAVQQATLRPGGLDVPASAGAVPPANFDAQPMLREPDLTDLPEPGERGLEANPTGEVEVQVVAVTTGNTTATWTGRLRPSGSDRDSGEEQSASWQNHLRASATAFGKMNADLPGPAELAVEAASIVEVHHQSPPFDQSADAAAEARDYGEQYRFVVEAIAGFLRRAGQAQAHLSPGRRRRLVTVLSDALSRQLNTRPRRSAAPPGGADHRRGHYAPPNTLGAGTSRIAPPSSRVRSSSEDDGQGTRRVRPRRPGPSLREPAPDRGRQLLALVKRSLMESNPYLDTASIMPSLISTLIRHLPWLNQGPVPDEARAAQIANMIAVDGVDAPQAFVDSRRLMAASSSVEHAEDRFLFGVYYPGEARDPSVVPFRPHAVRIRAFAADESRPAGISLADASGTGKLDGFLTDLWTVQRAQSVFDSFLLPAPADGDAMNIDEDDMLTVAPPWHVDHRNGGTFFVGLRGSVTLENGGSRFLVEAERGGTLSIDADTLTRLLLSDREFAGAMDEHAHSLTVLGWENGIPATLADDLARTMGSRLGREVSVYAATGTVVVGERADGVSDNGWVGVADGGHWQVSGYRDPEHNSGIASELASALAQGWRYAQPGQAAGRIDDSNRRFTLQLTRTVAESIAAGLAREPGVLSLQEAAQEAEQHANPYLPVLAALKLLTRNGPTASSIRMVRDVWTVRTGSADKRVLFPVVQEIWTRLKGVPGRTTSTGRAVIRPGDASATGAASRLTIRPREIGTTDMFFQLAALARQLAEAARPGLGGVSEHADIVVYGGGVGGTVASKIRDQLIAEVGGAFRTLGIDEPDLAEQVVLPFRHATSADDSTDPQVRIEIRSRAELVLEEYPWLPGVNPRRAEGGDFMMNCTLAAIEVDGGVEHGVVQPVPAARRSHAHIYDWARSNGRGFFRVGRGLGEITEAVRDGGAGSRALVVVYYRNLPGHAFNVVRHERLGVVYLDGQTSNGDPLLAMRDYTEEPSETWFVPTNENVDEVGVELTYEDFIRTYNELPVTGPANHGQSARPAPDDVAPDRTLAARAALVPSDAPGVAVPPANFGDLPEARESGPLAVGNTAGTGTGTVRPFGYDQDAGAVQWSVWEDGLRASAKVFGKMRTDDHSRELYSEAADIVALHHQSPPVDQSADAAREAREYGEHYRLIVAAIAGVLHTTGKARAHLSPGRRLQLASVLSDALSRQLNTRLRRSAAPPGGSRRRGGVPSPASAQAGPAGASSAFGSDETASSQFETQLGTIRPREASSSDEEPRDSRNTRPRLLAPSGTGQGRPAPPAVPPDPDREAAELIIARLVRDTRTIPPREQVRPGLGPDLFGSHQAPPAPGFMRRVYLDELSADQIVPFLRGISMTNEAPPKVGDLTSSKLPHEPDTVMTAHPRHATGRLLPQGRSRAPKLVMAIWFGGPPDVRRPQWRGLEGIRRSLGRSATIVLLTDVPRAHVEHARRAARARGPRSAGHPGDRFEAERARRLERMISWLKWADDNAVLLVNVDEISYKDQALTLDDASRAERARRTAYGFARASDIVRFSFTEVLGGLYTDWDNAVSAPFLNAPEGELLNSLQRLFQQQGYAVQFTADGGVSNAAFMAGIGHPFTKAVLRGISAKYSKPQRQLYAGTNFPHEPIVESPDKDETLVAQWVIPPEPGKLDLRNFRRSILLRTGPAATVDAIKGASPPSLSQFDIGFANSWEGGSPLQAEWTYLPEETYEVIRDVVATLVRDLYNREGDLHLTAVAPVIAGLPDPDLGWRAAIGYILSHPDLRGLITTVTDRDTWSPDERHTQTVILPLPADVRSSLGLSDAPNPEGEWLRGELARPTTISRPQAARPGQAPAARPRQQGASEELDPRARAVASEILRQRGYLNVVPGTNEDSGDNAAFIDEVARALQRGGDDAGRRAAEEGAHRRRRPGPVVRVQMARSDPSHGTLNQQVLRDKLGKLTPGSAKYKAVQAALDTWAVAQGRHTEGVLTPGSISDRREQDGARGPGAKARSAAAALHEVPATNNARLSSAAIDAASGAWKSGVRDFLAVVADALAATRNLLEGGPAVGPSSEPDSWRSAERSINDAVARLDSAEDGLLELARRAALLTGPPLDDGDEPADADELTREPVIDERSLTRAMALLGVMPTVIDRDDTEQEQRRESYTRVAELLREGKDREAQKLAAGLAARQGFLKVAVPGGVQAGHGLSVAGFNYTAALAGAPDRAEDLADMVAKVRQAVRDESSDGAERPHTLPLSAGELVRLDASWDVVERKLRKMIVAPRGSRSRETSLIPGGPVGKHPDFGAKTETAEHLNATNLARFLLGWTEAKSNRLREKELARQIETSPLVNLALDSVLLRMWGGLNNLITNERKKPEGTGQHKAILSELKTGRLADGRTATPYLSYFDPASGRFRSSDMPERLAVSVWNNPRGLLAMLEKPYDYPFREKIMGIHDFVEYFTTVDGSSGRPLFTKFHPSKAQYAFTFAVDERGRRVRGPSDPESERPVGWVRDEAGEWSRTRHGLDESSPWVTLARERKIPVWDGPSYTTARVLKYVDLVQGSDLEKASVAWALAAFWRLHYDHRETAAHTFHEVLDIAQNFGVQYSLNEPYAGVESLSLTSLENAFTRTLSALATAASGGLADLPKVRALLDKAEQFADRLGGLVADPGGDRATSVATVQEAVRLIAAMRTMAVASPPGQASGLGPSASVLAMPVLVDEGMMERVWATVPRGELGSSARQIGDHWSDSEETAVGDGDHAWPGEKIGQQAGKQLPAGRKGPSVSAIAEVHQFGASGMGRRLNLTDFATEGQLAAIARSGGLAGHDAVEALAARIAAAFTVPADGPDGPPDDVALTLTIRADRTPNSVTSGTQIVQAVASRLRHPVFLHLEESGVEFKVCW